MAVYTVLVCQIVLVRLAKSSTLWVSNRKTPVAVGGPCTSDGARHRVRRTELTRTLETSWQSSAKYDGARPQAVQTLVDQDSDLEQYSLSYG